MFDDVVGIKREWQRDEYVEQHDDQEQRDEAQDRLGAGERREAGKPGIDRAGEDEGHQPQVDEVDRHVGQRAGERDVVVTASLGPLFGGLFLGIRRNFGRVFGGWGHSLIFVVKLLGAKRLAEVPVVSQEVLFVFPRKSFTGGGI